MNTPVLEFRAATEDDIAQLTRLNLELLVAEGGEPTMSEKEYAERMQRWLQNGMRCVLGYASEEIVAYLLYFFDADTTYVRHFLVREGWRRRGIGRAMMRHMIDTVWPAQPVIAEALATNTGSLQFWRSLGFETHYIGLKREKTE